jgi:5-methylcytosine-specific restriction endonuclease McrA
MKRLFDFFRKKPEAEPVARRPDFFCLYCNAKFPHDDLERVLAHLKPHASKEEADARLNGAPPAS